MYILLLLLPLFVNAVYSCPTICLCDYGIVNCVNKRLNEMPLGIPANTRILILSNNQISSLTESSLAGLYHLEELHIDSNELVSIHKKAFRTNTKLKLLNLMNNNLPSLPDSLLNTNNELTYLDIRNNLHLRYVPYALINDTHTLKSLSANNVECNCNMVPWFERLEYFDAQAIAIDLECYYPSAMRGHKLQSLSATFEKCYTTTSTCGFGERACTDGLCIAEELWCDGNYDCYDISDEEPSCTPLNQSDDVCDPSKKFQCRTGAECIPLSWRCDGTAECTDGSDETSCSNDVQVHPCGNEFECSNKRCISHAEKCDGTNNCGDWSDESKLLCGDEGNMCAAGFSVCLGGETLCIENEKLCDGVQDCSDASDENNCGNCTASCRSDGRCIHPTWLCDKKPDCEDFSDEASCDYVCGEDEIKCSSGGCISCNFVCDGYNDCLGGSDETACAICNGSVCLESVQTESGTLTVIIAATAACACVSIAVTVLFIVICRRRKKHASRIPLQPPLYTEIEFSSPQNYYSDSPSARMPASPPPRYKSEPDIVARLTNNPPIERADIGLSLEQSEESESESGV